MIVKCEMIAEGPGPSEATVGILTVEGYREEVVLAKRMLHHGTMNIGSPLLHEKGRYLIELPRETASGRWRIWIPESEVADARVLQPAE
jgi:hypothetical protein